MDDKFQVDYFLDEKKIKINLPEEVWRNIDTVIMTRLFREELVVEKQYDNTESLVKNVFREGIKCDMCGKTCKEDNLYGH